MNAFPKAIFKRVGFDAALFICGFVVLPWFTMVLAIVGLFLFEQFYEIVFIGLLIDTLYGVPLSWLRLPAFYTVIASVLFLSALPLRKLVRY